MDTLSLFNVPVHDLSAPALRGLFRSWLRENGQRTVVTPNPEFLLQARRDAAFRGLLGRADLSLPDGVGLRYASAALAERPLAHRHTGVDTLDLLAALCAEDGKSLLLFGGEGGRAEQAAEALRTRHPGLDVAAYDPGPLAWTPAGLDVPPETVEAIQRRAPAVLAVALGQGKQERFIFDHLPALPSVRIAIGVGGALDMLSGALPRAPEAWRRAGLEWLWRLRLEPRRIGRIARAVVVFPAAAAGEAFRRRRFLKACRAVARLLFSPQA